MLVQNILSNKAVGVETIGPNTSVLEASEILAARKIGALIVSDDGHKIRGIVSERDIVREIGARGPSMLNDKIVDIMTAKVEACVPSDDAVTVLERMTSGRFRHMPVVDGDELIGIISIGDVVKARLGQVESENSALTDMIKGY